MCDIQSNMRYSTTNKFNSYCQKQENLTYVTTLLDSWKLYIKLRTIKNVTILRTGFGCFIFIFPCLKRLILVWQDLQFGIMVYNAEYCNVESKIMIKIIRENTGKFPKENYSFLYDCNLWQVCKALSYGHKEKKKSIGSTRMIKIPDNT